MLVCNAIKIEIRRNKRYMYIMIQKVCIEIKQNGHLCIKLTLINVLMFCIENDKLALSLKIIVSLKITEEIVTP